MPTVLSDPAGIHAAVDGWRAAGKRVGLVPTMGALHDGHRTLMREARAGSDVVIVSIYVNPLQFGPNEDFSAYPRPKDDDLRACDEEGVDLVMYLRDDDMYPPGFATRVRVEGLPDHLCGASRPDHFVGVTTIVTKLLLLAKPHRAWFGQKDAQQLLIIRRMVADLDFGVEIVAVPTVREADGLALSSRNAYLSPDDRAKAPALQRGLAAAADLWRQGERNVGQLLRAAQEPIEATDGMRIDYLDLVDFDTITPQPADGSAPPKALMAGAVFLGTTRLIDNQLLPPDAEF